MKRSTCILLTVLPFLFGTQGTTPPGSTNQSAAGLQVDSLHCEHLSDPLTVQESSPRLTWTLRSGRRAAAQSAYRVLVATSLERLRHDDADLWDSGRVFSAESVLMEYAGAALASRTQAFWKVMVWDEAGAPSAWSEPARWEMGLLDASDWRAKWIDCGPRPLGLEIESATYYSVDGRVEKDVTQRVAELAAAGAPIVASNAALGGDPAPDVLKRLRVSARWNDAPIESDVAENAAVLLPSGALPCLRRGFTIDKPVRRARLYATALGVYELWLNGARVGNDHLSPGWTDYRKRVRYQAYDVTAQLQSGENALSAIVGPGWFCGRAGLFHARAYYGKSPALLAQLEIEYADGTREIVASDESWKRHDSAILAADMMDGEFYDARMALPNWSDARLDDSAWQPVQTRDETRTLDPAIDEPVRVLEERHARSVSEPAPGRWTFDLGQNMVGVVRLRVQAARGTVITLRHAEMLNPDGTIYTANLRGAAAVDTYVCRGGGEETWQPRFTFHGFRYVELSGLEQRPLLEAVTGIVLGSDIAPTGEFSCSDPRINQLRSNVVWGMRGNYLSVPTDCPQRDERMGWTADAQVFLPTAAFEGDVAPFMSKWMIDVIDAQRADGAHADVAPVMDGLSYGTPAWGDAGVIVPWLIYEQYADRRILERSIDSMMRWVDWCREHSTHLIRDRDRGNDYGDWLSIGADTPKDLIGTAYFARSADLVSRSLAALSRNEEAARYRSLFEQVREAFVARYVDSSGRVHGDTQTGYVLALQFDLLPESLREAALRRLVNDVESRGHRISTGFVGVANLLPVLSRAGEERTALKLLLQEEFPSWLFSVKHGATTIWERWDGWTPDKGMQDPGMNSFNHYALGSCGEWLYTGLAGIRPDPQHPGFFRFTIQPVIGGGLTSVNARFRSIRGIIGSSWRLEGDRLWLDVEAPANTRAVVRVPARADSIVLESGATAERAEGVTPRLRADRYAEFEIGSGRYLFESVIANAP